MTVGGRAEAVDQLARVSPEELARRAGSGCAESFSLLADHFRPRLLQVIRARVGAGRGEDAEDIVQESLTRAWQKIDSYSFQYRFSTWLYTIALNITTDHVRRWKRQGVPSALPDVQDSTRHSAAAVADADALKNIWAVAEAVLSESQYTALWLRFGEELSVEEVAKAMGKSRVGTRVLLHRARGALLPHLLESHEFPQEASTSSGALP